MGRRSGRSCRCASLLEAFPAKYRSALCGLEWDGRFFSASRTTGAGFDLGVVARRSSPHARGPLGFAGLTALGFVLELLVVEEQLFPGSENEFAAAVDTLQNLVLKFHGELLPSVRDPKQGKRVLQSSGMDRTEGPSRLLQFRLLSHYPWVRPTMREAWLHH